MYVSSHHSGSQFWPSVADVPTRALRLRITNARGLHSTMGGGLRGILATHIQFHFLAYAPHLPVGTAQNEKGMPGSASLYEAYSSKSTFACNLISWSSACKTSSALKYFFVQHPRMMEPPKSPSTSGYFRFLKCTSTRSS